MKAKTNKIVNAIIVFVPLTILMLVGFWFVHIDQSGNKNFQENTSAISTSLVKAAVIDDQPDSININVPFVTQAPFRLWTTYPFNHTCEEASVLMLNYFLDGIKTVDENQTKQELLSMIDFENKTYGFSDDTTTAQTAALIRDYYGYDVKVFYNISSDDIKKELIKGNPVIVPTAGRLLFNPYFTPPGPVYHMLVIKGYDSEGFITNDPGTYRKGKDYKYSYEVLENAIQDFDQLTKSMNGRSAMIVVSLAK